MGIKREYLCLAHGRFDSDVPVCPRGCSGGAVQRRFFTPPGLTGDRTKNIDRTLETLAKDYGLTDMNNQGGTAAVKRPAPQRDFTPHWGSMMPGGTFVVGKGAERTEIGPGAAGTVAAMGGSPDNALGRIELPAPRAHVVARDDTKLDAGVGS